MTAVRFQTRDLTDLLREHTRRYPRMQPCDAVKLIYQNEFGGGHLIRDPAQCLLRLRAEWEATPPEPSLPAVEDIGNGRVRIYLAPLRGTEMTPEALNAAFAASAAARQGSMEEFLRKLADVGASFPEIGFSFSREAWEDYVRQYRENGCPMVSHSEIYRTAYHPAYRVLDAALLPDLGLDIPDKKRSI